MAFSIVSAAALLSTGIDADHPLPCEPVADVGGVTFTYQPATPSTATLAIRLRRRLRHRVREHVTDPDRAAAHQQRNGPSASAPSWQLPLPAFSGSAPAVSGEAEVAAQATGTGGVLMSPLGMATVAAEVAAGTGHSPVLLPTDSAATWQAPLPARSLTELAQADAPRRHVRVGARRPTCPARRCTARRAWSSPGSTPTSAGSSATGATWRSRSLETGTTAGQAAAAAGRDVPRKAGCG